jgi:hypothetical protein
MSKVDKELPLMTAVDDEMYDELMALVDQPIVHVALWEDSLADALGEQTVDAAQQSSFDIDLYLADGVYFELYGVACFDDPDAEAWQGLAESSARLASLVKAKARLSDIAVDEDDGLILVVAAADGRERYLAVSAWLLAEWDELPA